MEFSKNLKIFLNEGTKHNENYMEDLNFLSNFMAFYFIQGELFYFERSKYLQEYASYDKNVRNIFIAFFPDSRQKLKLQLPPGLG